MTDSMFFPCHSKLSVRGKNKKEKLAGLFSNFSKSADDMVLSSTQKDMDEFFEHERNFLTEYFTHIKDSTLKADRMTRNHKGEFYQLYVVTAFSRLSSMCFLSSE